MCLKAIDSALVDQQSECLNSLLRVHTPFPARTAKEEVAVRVADCACAPLKCAGGAAMIAYGAVLCPIPCIVSHIETHHDGVSVQIENIYLVKRLPNTPCHFEDHKKVTEFTPEGIIFKETHSTGNEYNWRWNGNHHFKGSIADTRATSSVTGYQCITSGIGRMLSGAVAVACCPCIVMWVGCCTGIGSVGEGSHD